MNKYLFILLIILIGCTSEDKEPNIYKEPIKKESEEITTNEYYNSLLNNREVSNNVVSDDTSDDFSGYSYWYIVSSIGGERTNYMVIKQPTPMLDIVDTEILVSERYNKKFDTNIKTSDVYINGFYEISKESHDKFIEKYYDE